MKTPLERKRAYQAKKVQETAPVQLVEESAAPMNGEELSVTELEQTAPAAPVVSAPPAAPAAPAGSEPSPQWINAGSYDAAAKIDPNISRSQYAYELSRHRRQQGLPDMSYAEWANIVKDHDPYETEAERQKREKNMRMANQLNAVGTFLNALVNYNRVKRGHVGYTPDKGTDTYNRLERLRLAQQQTARLNAKDYLNAIAQDRAERAKSEAARAASEREARNYQLKVAELEWKIANAKSEAERKAAADALAKEKFEHQKKTDEAKIKIAQQRANQSGNKGTEKYLELVTSKGSKRYTPEEYGNNWIHRAYQDMLKEPDGKKFAVAKYGGIYGESSTPSEQEMYDAITRYNDSQWKNQYRSGRDGGSNGSNPPPPLE